MKIARINRPEETDDSFFLLHFFSVFPHQTTKRRILKKRTLRKMSRRLTKNSRVMILYQWKIVRMMTRAQKVFKKGIPVRVRV